MRVGAWLETLWIPRISVDGNRCVSMFWSDAASKHATQAYFDCLRAEMERYGVEVTVVSPGYIRTNLSINAVIGDGSKYGGKGEERRCACMRVSVWSYSLWFVDSRI